MTQFRAGFATHVGRVRQVNQDRALLRHGRLYVVADGMGGHRGGEVAAQLAVDSLDAVFTDPSTEMLISSVEHANRVVFDRSLEDDGLHGMGTTVTALAVLENENEGEPILAIANVGDSRTYRLRNGEFEQLTDDHSVVGELMRSGQLTPEEAKNHRQRSILTRALGVEGDVAVDVLEVLPARGDRYLLCSDGLYGEVDDDVIGAVLRRLTDPDAAAKELVRHALEGGGSDNVTVVVVDVTDDDGVAERASDAIGAAAHDGQDATGELNEAPKPPVPVRRPRAEDFDDVTIIGKGPMVRPQQPAASAAAAATPVTPAAATSNPPATPIAPAVAATPGSAAAAPSTAASTPGQSRAAAVTAEPLAARAPEPLPAPLVAPSTRSKLVTPRTIGFLLALIAIGAIATWAIVKGGGSNDPEVITGANPSTVTAVATSVAVDTAPIDTAPIDTASVDTSSVDAASTASTATPNAVTTGEKVASASGGGASDALPSTSLAGSAGSAGSAGTPTTSTPA